MAKKRIAARTERVAENPVTHVLEVTVLDAAQRAAERVVAALDRERLALSHGDCYRLADAVRAAFDEMTPYQEFVNEG